MLLVAGTPGEDHTTDLHSQRAGKEEFSPPRSCPVMATGCCDEAGGETLEEVQSFLPRSGGAYHGPSGKQ